jgi:hypothetical protein
MYATLFDRNYLLRGLTMIESLHAVAPRSQVTVLALDWETASLLSDHQSALNLTILGLGDLDEPELWSARQTRCYRDFCWTLSSVLCHRLLQDHEEVIYLDADICFFNGPGELVDLCRSGQVAAVPHGFPDRLNALRVNGIFNVQWVYFAGHEGRTASRRWAEQCLDRCEFAPNDGIVGDQKYLDEWPSLYPSFISIDHIGAGVGPWNHEIREPQQVDGRWIVGTQVDMIFYHFHGLSISSDGSVVLSGPSYSEVRPLPRALYEDYLRRLSASWSRVRHLVPEPDPSTWLIGEQPSGPIRALARRLRSRFGA